MTKRLVAVLALGVVLLSACSKKENDAGSGDAGSCPSAPAALASLPVLPSGFPTPAEVAFTSTKTAGPSTIVEGFWDWDLAAAYDGWKSAFGSAGYTVTSSEKEADDAEVNFSGGGSTGQVKLNTECEGRTSIKVTIRPA